VAVHEVGHAISYAALFGYIPTQVAVLTASSDKNGFIGLHSIDASYNHLIWQIRCLMGGRVAEEIMFGKENVTGGAMGDLQKATGLAANLVRMYGMSDSLSRLDVPTSHHALYHNLDMDNSNIQIERVLREEKEEAHKLLKSKLGLIKDMADHLVKYEKISNEKFKSLCKEHGIECEYLDAKETIYPKYQTLYDRFWENEER
jgi:ATP-dependent Zn protease